MGKRKKDKNMTKDNQELELIPLVEEELSEEILSEPEIEEVEKIEEPENTDLSDLSDLSDKEEQAEQPVSFDGVEKNESEDSETSALFGAYVNNETKWERKNRIREEKEKRKEQKKRGKYKDVDDETYESMKARPGHVFFGVVCIFLVMAGVGLSVLGIYKLALSPAYEKVQKTEGQIEGLATATDTSGQITILQGVQTPTDLVDTWTEQEFSTPSDAQEQMTTTEEQSESE